jgi:hypothetical protein
MKRLVFQGYFGATMRHMSLAGVPAHTKSLQKR